MTQPGPVVFCGGQAYTLQGSLAIPAVGDVNMFVFTNFILLAFFVFVLLIHHILT